MLRVDLVVWVLVSDRARTVFGSLKTIHRHTQHIYPQLFPPRHCPKFQRVYLRREPALCNELIVGSRGEMDKCPINIGNKMEVIGNIREYRNQNERVHKWLKHNPFSDAECRSCIALPGCMGDVHIMR